MKAWVFLPIIAIATAMASPVQAADMPRRAEIPFANHGGIWDWRADGRDAILIKSRNGAYYRATFMAECFGLPYTEQIGFVTQGTDTLDKFGSVLVRGQRCVFDSFTEIPRPGNW